LSNIADLLAAVPGFTLTFRVHLESLQRLKGRTALIVECHDFAVDNRVLNIKGGHRIEYLGEFLAKILLLARQEPSFRAAA
jgi:hypothetical protein